MMYWLTQSLLSAWIYYRGCDDAYTESAYESFLQTLRREPKEPTKAMQDGIRFESAVNTLCAGQHPAPDKSEKWNAAVRKIAGKCRGGQMQTPLTSTITVDGIDFCLYGIADYVKSGTIYDIKKVTRYEYGKYFDSPQHPMYLHLLPEAKKFTYLIFDGNTVYEETYRRGDFMPIEQTIQMFIAWLRMTNNLNLYFDNWKMNEEREEKIYGIYGTATA